MDLACELQNMTTEEKLFALEQIWDDICRKPKDIPSPAWHGSILGEREKGIEEGRLRFHDWEEAKQKILDMTR